MEEVLMQGIGIIVCVMIGVIVGNWLTARWGIKAIGLGEVREGRSSGQMRRTRKGRLSTIASWVELPASQEESQVGEEANS